MRAIDDKPTREMSVFEGHAGAARRTGLEGDVDGHPRQRQPIRTRVELTRERCRRSEVTSRIAAPGVGYVRDRGDRAAHRRSGQVADRRADKGRRREADRRCAAHVGRLARAGGLALARLFVGNGHAGDARDQGRERERRSPRAPATARSSCRRLLLVDAGTSGAAELFASALAGNKRAELVGEHTIGRAASQRLDQAAGRQRPVADHDALPHPCRGRRCTKRDWNRRSPVDEPEVEFGQPPPPADPMLDKALELIGAEGKAAGRRCHLHDTGLRSSNACISRDVGA